MHQSKYVLWREKDTSLLLVCVFGGARRFIDRIFEFLLGVLGIGEKEGIDTMKSRFSCFLGVFGVRVNVLGVVDVMGVFFSKPQF